MIRVLKRGGFLLFEYPIAVICQILSAAAALFGFALIAGIGGVESLVIYGAVSEFSSSHPEYLGWVIMLAGIVAFVGFFIRHNKMIFVSTYVMIIFWLFICLLYLFTGVSAATFFYVGPQVLILSYAIIYITLNKNVKISPLKALTRPEGSDILDHHHP